MKLLLSTKLVSADSPIRVLANWTLKFYHSIAARGEDVEEVLRLAELEEEGALTQATEGKKVVPSRGELGSNGDCEVPDDEREDGEVDEEVDVSVASEGVSERGASKMETVPPAKHTGTRTEQLEKCRTSEMDTSVGTSTTGAPGKTTAPFAGESFQLHFLLGSPEHADCPGRRGSSP
jgi:hypothetical protein